MPKLTIHPEHGLTLHCSGCHRYVNVCWTSCESYFRRGWPRCCGEMMVVEMPHETAPAVWTAEEILRQEG